jgi:hypothetical protein
VVLIALVDVKKEKNVHVQMKIVIAMKKNKEDANLLFAYP